MPVLFCCLKKEKLSLLHKFFVFSFSFFRVFFHKFIVVNTWVEKLLLKVSSNVTVGEGWFFDRFLYYIFFVENFMKGLLTIQPTFYDFVAHQIFVLRDKFFAFRFQSCPFWFFDAAFHKKVRFFNFYKNLELS